MRCFTIIVSMVVALFFFSNESHAALLAYDGFVAGTDNALGEYVANPGSDTSERYFLTDGQNPILSGFAGSWTEASGARLELGTTPLPSLSYSDGADSVATSGNVAFRKWNLGQSTRALDSSALGLDADGKTRYFSFLMKLGDPTARGQIEFAETADGYGTGLRIYADGANLIATGNSSATTLGATDTDTHFFVWKLSTAAGASDNWQLFMDPELSLESANTPVASMNGGGSSIDLAYLVLKRLTGGTGGNGVMFDEIRIGETWNDVTTVGTPSIAFSDDFEAYAIGSELSAPWMISSTDGNTSTVNVVADPSPFSSGTNAVNFYDNSTTLNPKIEYDLMIQTVNPLTIQFDFKLNSSLGFTQFQIEGTDGMPSLYLALTYATSELRNYTSSSTYDLILDTDVDVWYHVDIQTSGINPSGNETYDISVTPFGGSATTVTNLMFRNDTATAFSRVQFIQNSSAAGQSDIVLDNFSISENLTPYEEWTQSYILIGDNADYDADPDGDALNNLGEWALGGDPTDEFDQGIPSVSGIMSDGSTNWFVYIYPSNTVAADLVYYLETDTDLIVQGWTNTTYEIVGASAADGNGFSYVTNRIPTAAEDKQFVRLVIEETP